MANLTKFKKILILRGGISDELEISRLTANQVFETIKPFGDVEIIDVTRDSGKLFSELQQIRPNIIFNGLHGFFGEDGQIQSILNYLRIPYTHSGVLTSALCMNKVLSKELFINQNIRTPKHYDINQIKSKKINFPLILKPINGGSSKGLYKINNERSLNKFFGKKKKLKNILVEEYINGRELTVGILENKVCGIMELKFSEELYDYENKYINIAKHIINPKLPKNIEKELIKTSTKIHKFLNCNCISRIDFRYNEEKNKIYLLEVNTQPGLTKNSLLPEMAEKKGISFIKICEILLNNTICEI